MPLPPMVALFDYFWQTDAYSPAKGHGLRLFTPSAHAKKNSGTLVSYDSTQA